jgi:hypothetical protein
MSLVGLPYELVAYVVGQLDLADVRSLTLSCKRFQFLLHEANITKLILEVGFKFPPVANSLADALPSPRHPTVPRPMRLAPPRDMQLDYGAS